jgi:putative ABC transport system permease protein
VFRMAIKTTLANKRRLVGTALSVIIGIAFLAGTFVFTDTIKRTFDNLFADVYKNTDAVVRSSVTIEADFGVEGRERLPVSAVEQVAAVPGVATAAGDLQGFARIIDKDGNPIGRTNGPPNFAQSASPGELSVWKLADGRLPTGPTEMAMDKASADKGHFAVGDQVRVQGQVGTQEFTLVGIAKFGTADSPGGATFAIFDLATTGEFIGQPGKVDTVLVKAEPGISQSEMADRLRAALPADHSLEVLTGAEITKESQDTIEQNLSFFNILLLVFAGIALFVSSFIIYNTFSIIVAQRQRANALLRAIGASRRQIIGQMLVEAVIIGVVASVIGFFGGILMSSILKGLLAVLGLDLPTGGLVLLPRTMIVSLIVGVGITVIASVFPALRASRVPPVAAMKDVEVDRGAASRKRLVAGLVLAAIGVALTAIGLTTSVGALALGLPLLFMSLFVLGPLIAKPVAGAIGWPLPKVKGMTGTIARQNTTRNPTRTARTAAALMVGVALVAGISVLAASIKGSVRSIFEKQFTGDFVVSTDTFGFGGLPTTLASSLAALPEVQAAAGVQIGLANIEGSDQTISVVDPVPASQIFDFDFVAGAAQDLTDDGILLSKARAEKLGRGMGDTVSFTMLDGVPRALVVQGIYSKSDLAGPYTVSKGLYSQSGGDQFDFSVFVTTKDGVSDADAEAALRTVTDAYPTATLESRNDYITSQASQIDVFVNLVYGLLALAVIIAVFGIANTLSLSVYERTRELGLLRAVGMGRAQVRSTVRWESVLTSLLGTLQGIVVGILLGYATILALRDQGLNTFTVPVLTLAVVVLLAIVAGVVAAIRPARRAAKLDVLHAISTE